MTAFKITRNLLALIGLALITLLTTGCFIDD